MIRLSAQPDEGGTTFSVFTTTAKAVFVRLFDATGKPVDTHPLENRGDGLWSSRIPNARLGALYKYVLDDDEVPDPYARFLPFGVHGPARVCASSHEAPLANPRADWSIYELHVGTFSAEGTYAGAIAHLDHLVALGIDAIELMPLAAFPGERGWGYDGVALFAPFARYGEPDDLRALVREAHARGLAVILDVVYNHFGPDGNYLARYAPEYFHASASTPWGQAPAYDFAPMRALVLENVRYWLEEQGIDALRLDATATIEDPSEPHILREITNLAHALGRRVFFEDDRNDPRVVTELGADGVWADDLHHQLHVLVTDERDGYYAAYEPTIEALARCINDGWSFTGQPYPPWKGKPRGHALGDVAHRHLVTCLQNHDQVGNRALGARLSTQTGPELFTALTLLLFFLPSTPLLFMGQEWAASSPFLFFTDHHGELGDAVSRGRRAEFAAFAAFADAHARAQIPDPQAKATFESSKLRWAEIAEAAHSAVLAAHRTMLRLRRDDAVLAHLESTVEASAQGRVLRVLRRRDGETRALYVNFGDEPATFVHLSQPHAVLAGTLDGDLLPARTAVVLG